MGGAVSIGHLIIDSGGLGCEALDDLPGPKFLALLAGGKSTGPLWWPPRVANHKAPEPRRLSASNSECESSKCDARGGVSNGEGRGRKVAEENEGFAMIGVLEKWGN
ncbi:hypothetical protein AAG906_008227 [Vitis piasezkii]